MAGRQYKNQDGKYSTQVAVVDNEQGQQQEVSLVAIEDTKLSKVNAGRFFTGCFNVDALADNGEVYLLLETGEKELHLEIDIKAVGQFRIQSFTGATITDNGTVITPFNRRTGCENTLESTFYQGATVTDDGTERLSFRTGAETSFFSATSTEDRDDIESIICANDSLILKITNESGSPSYLSVIVDCYEEEQQ